MQRSFELHSKLGAASKRVTKRGHVDSDKAYGAISLKLVFASRRFPPREKYSVDRRLPISQPAPGPMPVISPDRRPRTRTRKLGQIVLRLLVP